MWSKKKVFSLNHTVKNTKKLSIFRGLILAILSGVSFSLIGVMVKELKNLHPGQLAVYRFMGLLVMSMPEAVKTGQNPLGPRNLRFLMLLRGTFATLSSFMNIIAYQHLELGEASVIIFSSPVLVTIFARIFFKEPCYIYQTIAVILTVIGIIFNAKLPFLITEEPIVYSSEKIYGLLAATISLFCCSAAILITRKVRCVHPSIINFHFSCVGTFEISILTLLFGNFRFLQCGIQSIYMFLLALCGYGSTTLFVMALQCENAGPVSTIRSAIDIGMAFLWQVFIFHEVPDIYGIISAILILVSVIVIGFEKWLTTLHGDFLSCEKLKFFSM